MTVRDLIEILQEFDEDTTVAVIDPVDDKGSNSVKEVKPIKAMSGQSVVNVILIK